MVGFGFKVAAVPFHQWAPEAYEGAPAPVTAWIATGSKLASFVAMMKVFLHALLPLVHPVDERHGAGAGSLRHHRGDRSGDHDLRQLRRAGAAELETDAGLLFDRPRGLHPGRRGRRERARTPGRVAAASGALLPDRLRIRQRRRVRRRRLAGAATRTPTTSTTSTAWAFKEPLLAACILVLMLSLIGIPPLAGFFAKLYVFMAAARPAERRRSPITLIWLVALGLFNSVVSAFYYVRVLKAMFLRARPGAKRRLAPREPAHLPADRARHDRRGDLRDHAGLAACEPRCRPPPCPMLTSPIKVPPADAKHAMPLAAPRPRRPQALQYAAAQNRRWLRRQHDARGASSPAQSERSAGKKARAPATQERRGGVPAGKKARSQAKARQGTRRLGHTPTPAKSGRLDAVGMRATRSRPARRPPAHR